MHDITTHGAGDDTTGYYTYLLKKGGSWTATESTEDPDRIEQNGRRASGKVENSGHDTFRGEGTLADVNFTGEVGFIEIAGLHFSPAELDSALPLDLDDVGENHRLEITSNNQSDYEFRTTGATLTPHSAEGPDKLTHNGTGATGHVEGGGTDSFTIHGTPDFDVFDPGASAQVTLDGEGVSGSGLTSGSTSTSSSGTSGNNGGSSQPTSSPSTSGGTPENKSEDHQATISAPDDTDAIGGGLWHPAGEEKPQWGMVGRYEKTTQDRTITVDPNEDGGVQRVFNRLPKEIEHDITIELLAGRHTGNGSAVRTGRIWVNSTAQLKVVGEGMGRTKVASGINMESAGKLSHIELHQIHWETLSQFQGPVWIQHCKFTGFPTAGANADGTAAISGKNGRVVIKNSVIGNPDTDEYAIWPTNMEWYAISNCTLNATNEAIKPSLGSIIRKTRCTENVA